MRRKRAPGRQKGRFAAQSPDVRPVAEPDRLQAAGRRNPRGATTPLAVEPDKRLSGTITKTAI